MHATSETSEHAKQDKQAIEQSEAHDPGHEHASGRLTLHELREIAAGRKHQHLNDMDFIESLGAQHCLLMAPFIYHMDAEGHMEQVTPIRYDDHYEIDKANTLLAVLNKLHHRQ